MNIPQRFFVGTLIYKPMESIELRQVTCDDLELLLAWRSNPRIYEYFFDQDEPLKWEDHVRWFGSRHHNRQDLMILYQGRRVGTVSIDSEGRVSIFIGEETLWGNGIATQALKRVCDIFDDDQLEAKIHKENKQSIRLFKKCGFKQTKSEDDWLLFHIYTD